MTCSTVALLVLFSQYLKDVPIPLPKGKKVYLFRMFPVLLTILIMWMMCAIFTATDVFGDNDAARTDLNGKIIGDIDWARVPYPFQWGVPNVTVAGVFGMLAGVLASAIESVGDYYACARLAGTSHHM